MKMKFTEAAAWLLMLLVSNMPDALVFWWTGERPAWPFWLRLDLAGAVALVAMVWPRLRSLRDFAAIMFVVLLARYMTQLDTGPGPWVLGGAGFVSGMMGFQILRLAGAALVIGALLAMGYRRADFFLARGAPDVPGRPIRWLALPRAEPWTRIGPRIAALAFALMLAYTAIASRMHPEDAARMLVALPVVLPLAAINAFAEEMILRAPLIATLEGPIGRRYALWIPAVFFGISRWNGMPSGWPGVLAGTFFGWMMGRAMVETRGIFWAWLIHFAIDVVVFAFLAAGLIRPGG